MSFGSFFAGLTGLQANSTRLQVIGNNLANLNTVGFKANRASFQDIFSGFVGVNGAGNPQQIGLGTQIASVDGVFSQGSLQSTSLLTDMAIQGNGFFVLGDGNGGQSFTRSGNFSFDGDGNLISSNGGFVQGFTQLVNGSIATSGTLSNIQIPTGLTAPATATSEIQATVVLNTNDNIDGDDADAIGDGAPFTASISIVDSQGARHDLSITFSPTDTTNRWAYSVTVDPNELGPGGPADGILAGGEIVFDSNGQITPPVTNPTIAIGGWANGAGAQTVTWNLTDDAGTSLITQGNSESSVSTTSQDGFEVGTLRRLVIDQDGLVSGVFSNGANLEIARIAIANFNNPNGLVRDGSSTFLATASAGSATIGAANSGGRGQVLSNSLELSNVDITQEFTDMIVSQRGYQANSRIITTTDEVIQEALTLKR